MPEPRPQPLVDTETNAGTLVSGLPIEISRLMSGLSILVQFEAGERVFTKGEPAGHFFVIRFGRVSVEIDTDYGAVAVQTIGPGDILGWSWLFPPYRWNFNARAVEQTRAIRVDGAALRSHCEADHSAGYELYRRFTNVMLERLQATRSRLISAYGMASTHGDAS